MSKRLLTPEEMGYPSLLLKELGIQPQQPGEDSLDAQMRIDEAVANVSREKHLDILNRLYRSTSEDSGPPEFELLEDDYGAIDAALCVARRMLIRLPAGDPRCPGLQRAIAGLERLPEVTPDLDVQFGLVLRKGDETFHEMRYLDFTISDCALGISAGGSVWEKPIGGDSYTDLDWVLQNDGYRSHSDGEANFWWIEGTAQEYLNLGAEITVQVDQEEIGVSEEPED